MEYCCITIQMAQVKEKKNRDKSKYCESKSIKAAQSPENSSAEIFEIAGSEFEVTAEILFDSISGVSVSTTHLIFFIIREAGHFWRDI